MELFFPKSSKTSNITTIVDHSDSDQESINEEFIDEDVCDNTTEEEISVERIQYMVCSMQIARKSSSSGVRNESETSIEDIYNEDIAHKIKGVVLSFFDGNSSAAMDFPRKMIL